MHKTFFVTFNCKKRLPATEKYKEAITTTRENTIITIASHNISNSTMADAVKKSMVDDEIVSVDIINIVVLV